MERQAIIVDDNPLNLESLALLLIKEGFTPITLKSPRDLTAALDRVTALAVIFLDLEFPNDHGYRVVERLQADERLAEIPVVAYTVHTSEQNEAQAAGFHSFIGKPLNLDRFPDQLRRILNGERVWETD